MALDRKKTESPKAQRPAGHSAGKLQSLEQFVVEEIEMAGDVALAVGGPAAKKRPRWLAEAKRAAAWSGLWSMLVIAALSSRSLWPADETRLMACAWEMWLRGNYLVPVMNGAPYSHQPPLILWLYLLGWKLIGVNAWWPRLVPGLFGLASMFLSAAMARFLWPGRDDVARYAPIVLLGGFFWAFYTTLALPDLVLAFFTLLALYALLWIWRKRDLRVWLLLALAFGLGTLAGGVMIYVYVLPPALLAPLWANTTPKPRWKYWYADILKASLFGLVIFLAWDIPAFVSSDPQSLAAAFFTWPGQISIATFPSGDAWWWYLFLLPILGLPWSIWPLVWIRLWHIRRAALNGGLLFCLAWSVPAIFILSLFSVRQPQYLLPVVPAFSLAVTYLLLDDDLLEHAHDTVISSMALSVIAVGGLLAILPGLPRVDFLPGFLWQISPFVGIAIVVVGMALGWVHLPPIRQRIVNMAGTAIVLGVFTLLLLGWQFDQIYQVDDVANVLAIAQHEKRPIAHVGTYDGQFQFAGRLQQPLDVIDGGVADSWLAAHPRGLLVTYSRGWQPAASAGLRLVYEHPYLNQRVRVWKAAAPVPPDSPVKLP